MNSFGNNFRKSTTSNTLKPKVHMFLLRVSISRRLSDKVVDAWLARGSIHSGWRELLKVVIARMRQRGPSQQHKQKHLQQPTDVDSPGVSVHVISTLPCPIELRFVIFWRLAPRYRVSTVTRSAGVLKVGGARDPMPNTAFITSSESALSILVVTTLNSSNSSSTGILFIAFKNSTDEAQMKPQISEL